MKVKIASITLDPDNKRKHDDKNVRAIRTSLERFGQQTPVVIDAEGRCLKGNGTILAAKDLGWTSIDAVRTKLSGRDAEAYAVADNRAGELATWERTELAKFLEDMHNLGDLECTGFDEADLDAMITALENEMPPAGGEDVDPGELPEDPTARVGDTWRLGPHMLTCGDSTDPEAMSAVLCGAKASMVWSDPPYGVSYVGKTEDALTIQNDDLDEEGLGSLLAASLGLASKNCSEGAAWYIAAPPGPLFHVFGPTLLDLGIWRQTIVWVKDQFVMGGSDFHYRHEPIFYGWTPGSAHRPPPDRKQDTVWEIPRPRVAKDHPTMKPIALVEKALLMSSAKGALVLDPFGGSGTTLLACESTCRRAALIEIDPRYCDVIIRRWEEATGGKAILQSVTESAPVTD